METGSASAIKIILWILAANALLILSAYGLVAWCRKQARDTIRGIGDTIQGFANQMNQLAEFLHAYLGIDQEPFFTPLDTLQKEAGELEARVNQFLDTCRAFEVEVTNPTSNRLQEIINAPFIWFRRWQRAIELRRECSEIAGQMDSADERMQSIYELPWELAGELRQAAREVEEFLHHVQWLQSKGTRGISLQKAASQVPVIQQALNGIPVLFLQAEKGDLLASSNLDTTIFVFKILSGLRPALNRYLPQVREWRTHLEKATTSYTELKQAGVNLRQALSNPPAGLTTAPLQERLDQVAQLATEVNQRLTQPDADTLKSLAREISQLNKVLQDTEQQLDRAGKQVGELHAALEELKDGLEKLSTQITVPEHAPIFPLAWDESAGALEDLRQKVQALGPAQQARTPDQVTQQHAQINALRAAYKNLAEIVPQATSQHAALTALLDSAHIRDGTAWLRKNRELLEQAKIYDPKNWPKKDTPQALDQELDALETLQTSLCPADRAAPVMESELGQRLKGVQQLAGLHKLLRPRAENIRSRLEKLKGLEEQSKDQLSSAWSALEKVALLSESNDLIAEIIDPEIDALGDEIRQLGNEINNHAQGEVEKKAQRTQLQTEKVNLALNQWISRLNAGVIEQSKGISDRLVQIDAITHLEEAAVQDARALIQREEVNQLRSAAPAAPQSIVGRVTTRITHSEPRSAFNNLEAITEIKRKNDLWQMLSAAQVALGEKSAGLIAAHQETVQARSEAGERLGELASNFPEKRAWPPHNQAALTENQVLQPLDEKWDALKKRNSLSEPTILELGRLAQQYRLASERIKQALNRIQQDQERIQDLEWQVDALKQRWQSQVNPANSIMRESVQLLLSQTDSKLSYIKQQYMRGVISYEQAIQNLQLLYDELFSAQVPVDEQNKTGLSEPHRREEQKP